MKHIKLFEQFINSINEEAYITEAKTKAWINTFADMDDALAFRKDVKGKKITVLDDSGEFEDMIKSMGGGNIPDGESTGLTIPLKLKSASLKEEIPIEITIEVTDEDIVDFEVESMNGIVINYQHFLIKKLKNIIINWINKF